MNWLLLMTLSCATRTGVSTSTANEANDAQVAKVIPLQEVTILQCTTTECTVQTKTAQHVLNIRTGAITTPDATDKEPIAEPVPWPLVEDPIPLADQWNRQIANDWRSPFRREVPSPDGGSLRMIRGLSAHTSRIMRVGGKVVVARQAPPPEGLLYPRIMALHPTGQEAYLVVWPNPDLIAFQPNSLETNWRIRLGDPAVGLFVSADGRFLVAETGGIAPDEQLLDYEANPVDAPTGQDPASDQAIQSITRPVATHTLVIDLALGAPVARLPGPFKGFQTTKSGAVVASAQGVSILSTADQ